MTTTRVSRADLLPPLTDDEARALLLVDPDATPQLQGDQKATVHQPATVRTLRRKLRLSQDAFAKRYGIPVGDISNWEQYRTKPDAAAETYLRVIAADPEAVARLVAGQAKRRSGRAFASRDIAVHCRCARLADKW